MGAWWRAPWSPWWIDQTGRAKLLVVGDWTHTDQGSQYRGSDYLKLLRKHGISCSVSTKGSYWDDAVVEGFFSTLKFELNLNYDIIILFN